VILSAQHALALARGVAVGAACVLAALPLRALLARSHGASRRLVWFGLLAPFLTPVLLVGYAYSNYALSLVRQPGLNAAFYGVLLWLKLTPLAAILLYLAPRPVSPEAVHCRRLLRAGEHGVKPLLSYLAFLAGGPLRACALAFLLVFLFAFAEFEMASLMSVRTWTVSLFDDHAGGLAMSESLRRCALPAAVELVLLGGALVIAFGSAKARGQERRRPPLSPVLRVVAWAELCAAVVVVTAVPCAIVFRGAASGFGRLLESFAVTKDIAASALFGAGAAVCAYLIAGRIVRWSTRSRAPRAWFACAFLLCIPGLLGPLVLSLLIVSAFQTSALGPLYGGPVPLLATLCLTLLPFAFVLWFAVHLSRRGEALHAAQLLRESGSSRVLSWRRRLLWELRSQKRFWVLFLLFFWAYLDLTASAILAPPGMTPVTVRLYNQMHYGQVAVLSALVAASLLVPVLLLLIVGGGRGIWSRLTSYG